MSVATTETALAPDVRAVLRQAEPDDDLLRLTTGPLPFALLERVHAAVREAGGRWHRHRRGFVFARPWDMDGLLGRVGPAGLLDRPLPFVPTPPGVADKLVRLAEVPACGDWVAAVLDPSAGDGALLDAVERRCGSGHLLRCGEADPLRAAVLARRWPCHHGDFLAARPSEWPRFHRILMAPPWTSPDSATAWADHVMHGYEFLTGRGILAAVVPETFTRATSHQKLVRFARFAAARGRWYPLEPGAVGRPGTRAVIVVLYAEGPTP